MLWDSNPNLLPFRQLTGPASLSAGYSLHCASGNTMQPVYDHCSARRAVLYHIETHSNGSVLLSPHSRSSQGRVECVFIWHRRWESNPLTTGAMPVVLRSLYNKFVPFATGPIVYLGTNFPCRLLHYHIETHFTIHRRSLYLYDTVLRAE
jgi:hypothetical protein